MILGDEGKSMTILERISDEPRDVEPYLAYLLKNLEGTIAYWDALPNDRDPEKPTARECVLTWLQMHQIDLENVLQKLRRERAEERDEGKFQMRTRS